MRRPGGRVSLSINVSLIPRSFSAAGRTRFVPASANGSTATLSERTAAKSAKNVVSVAQTNARGAISCPSRDSTRRRHLAHPLSACRFRMQFADHNARTRGAERLSGRQVSRREAATPAVARELPADRGAGADPATNPRRDGANSLQRMSVDGSFYMPDPELFGHPDAYPLFTGFASKLEEAGLAGRFPLDVELRQIAIELLAERSTVEEVEADQSMIEHAIRMIQSKLIRCSFVTLVRLTTLVNQCSPSATNVTPSEVTISRCVAYNGRDAACSTRRAPRGAGGPSSAAALARHRRPLGCRDRQDAKPDRVRHLRPAARLREGAGEALRRPVRARRGRPPDPPRRRPRRRPRRTSAPEQGVDYSGTNVQEEGVDEPDMVKTDGNTLFAVANGKLNAVDVSGPKPRLLDSLALEPAWSHELLLHGDRLLVLSRGGYWIEPLPAMAARHRAVPAGAVGARRGGRVRSGQAAARPHAHARRLLRRRAARRRQRPDRRLVAAAGRAPVRAARPPARPRRSPPRTAEPTPSSRARASRAGCRPTGSSAPARSPAGRARSSSAATSAARPAFSGLGMLTVLTVDLTKGLEPVDSAAVMTDGRIVYASPESLYVATERWADRPDPDKPTDGAGRRPDRDPQVRHLEPDEDAVPRQRQGLGLPAQPVVALRVQGRPARRQHREPGLVGTGPARPSRS